MSATDPYGSSNPYSSPHEPAPSTTNGWGLAGMITAIVSLFCLGFTSVIALIVSAIGLTKKPKGMAIAGVIISLIGLGVMGGTVVALMAAKKGVEQFGDTFVNAFAVGAAKARINAQAVQDKKLPETDAGQTLLKDITDMQQNPLQYKKIDEENYEIRSAGPDKVMNTADDVSQTGTLTEALSPGSGNSYEDAEGDIDDAEMPEDSGAETEQ